VRSGAKAVGGTAEGLVPPANAESYAWAIDWFVGEGYDVVVTVGFLTADATLAAARDHPGVQFIGVDQSVPPAGAPRNYQRLVFDEAQAGYLAGIVAATMSGTHTIGAVGGMGIPPVESFIRGFRSGAVSADPTVKVLVSYAGSFVRPDLGEQAAAAMVAGHADVIFGVAGAANLGIFSTACGGRLWAIGVDVDQYVSVPAFRTCILTSAEKRLAHATSLAIARYAAAGLQGGEYLNDASNGGIGLAPIRNVRLPQGLADTLKETLKDLADGTIEP